MTGQKNLWPFLGQFMYGIRGLSFMEKENSGEFIISGLVMRYELISHVCAH